MLRQTTFRPLLPAVTLGLCLLGLCLLTSCGNSPSSGNSPVERPNPAAIANTGNLSNVVFLGDSLTAGEENGGLLDTEQVHGYTTLLAQQAGVPITLPLIAAPGVPNVMQLDLDPLGIVFATGTSPGRDYPSQQATDLAVPGATLEDIFYTTPSNTTDLATQYILGDPGLSEGLSLSQALWAQRLAPTTIVLWGGNVEAINAVAEGSTAALTSVSDFTTEYSQLIGWFTQNTNAHLVLLNVPDVTRVPYLISAQQAATIASGLTGADQAYFYAIWGVTPQDYLNASGVEVALSIIEDPSQGPLASGLYLTPDDISVIQSTVNGYNYAIVEQAHLVDATLVDMHTALLNLAQNGATINGTPVTFQYLDGIFSLDGIHPTNTGYALTANIIIQALDSDGAEIPQVDVGPIAAADPLFPANMPERPYIPFISPPRSAVPAAKRAPARRNSKGGYLLPPELVQWREQARQMQAAMRQTLGRHAALPSALP